jgi:hypothetical protein
MTCKEIGKEYLSMTYKLFWLDFVSINQNIYHKSSDKMVCKARVKYKRAKETVNVSRRKQRRGEKSEWEELSVL